MRKQRADSKLGALKPEVQEELAEVCRTEKLEAARTWLKDTHGVAIALSGLSDWYASWRLERRFASAANRADQAKELLKRGTLSAEKISELGQAIFELEALDTQDAKTYLGIQKLKLDQESAASRAKLEKAKLALQERRVVVLEKKMQEAVSVANDTTLSTEEQAKRIREILGKE